MGLSIFYSGRLRRMQQLPDLVHEVRDICDHLGWAHDVYQSDDGIPLQGIWMAPPGSDLVWLTFTVSGYLASPVCYVHEAGRKRTMRHKAEVPLIDTITQYAGPDLHMKLIGLLQYLSEKYFDSFKLTDESEYWETGDTDRCRQWFDMFEIWMDQMSADIGRIDSRGFEPGHSVYERVADLARQGRLKEWIMLDGLKFIPPKGR